MDGTYGTLLTFDELQAADAGGRTIAERIATTPQVPFIDGAGDLSVIRYFDPISGTTREVDLDFSPLNAPTAGGDPTPSPVEIGQYRNINLETNIRDLGKGFAAAAELKAISSEPNMTFDFNDVIGRSSKVLSGGDVGFALVGIGQIVFELGNGADPLQVASAYNYTLSGLSLAVAEFLDTVYGTETATQLGKYTALKAFSAVTGAAGAITSIVGAQDQRQALIDAGRPTTALDIQIGLEAGAAGLMALDAALSVLVAAGKITGLAAKAVPLIGSVAQLMLSFNPAQKVFFDIQEDAIADAKARNDYSSALAADLLQNRLDVERDAATDALITNLVSGGLGFLGSLAGLGAALGVAALSPFGPILGAGAFAVGAVAVVLQFVNNAKLKKLAEEAREKILDTEGVETYQDYFDLSFDQQQERLQEAFLDVVIELTEAQGFGSVIGLSTQRFTQDDVTVAREADIANQITRSSAVYLSEYKDDWTDVSANLVSVAGPDEIRLDASDQRIYFTVFNTTLASGERSPLDMYDFGALLSSNFGNKNAAYLFTTYDYSDLDGWKVVDAEGNETTFDLTNIVNLARIPDVDALRQLNNDLLDIRRPRDGFLDGNDLMFVRDVPVPTKVVALPFIVDAGDNNDFVFAYDSSVVIDGGAGTDTVSYVRLDTDILLAAENRPLFDDYYDGTGTGIVIRSHADRLESSQYLMTYGLSFDDFTGALDDPDAIIAELVFNYDNGLRIQAVRTDISGSTPEFFAVRDGFGGGTSYDQITNVEVIQGSAAGDWIDLRGYAAAGSNAIEELYGFDGDDMLIADTTTVTIGAGLGDDIVDIALPWSPLVAAYAAFAAAEATLLTTTNDDTATQAQKDAAKAAYDTAKADLDSKAIYVSGGDGRDALRIGTDAVAELIAAHEQYEIAALETDLLFSAVSGSLGNSFGDNSVADLFKAGLANITDTFADKIDLQDLEGIEIALAAPTFTGTATPETFATLPYLTPALNGVRTGNANYDNVFYGADYTRIIDDMFAQTFTVSTDGYGIEVFKLEGTSQYWENYSCRG